MHAGPGSVKRDRAMKQGSDVGSSLPLAFSPFDLYPAPFDSILPGAERKAIAVFTADDRAQARFPVFSPSVKLEPFRGSKGFARDDVAD